MKFKLVLLIFLFSFYGCSFFTDPEEDQNSSGDTKVSQDFVALSDETLNNILDYDETGRIVIQANDQTSSLEAGNIINAGPIEKAPYGFLKTITSIKRDGANFEIITEDASLAEVFQDATVDYNQQLTAADLVNSEALGRGVSLNKAKSTEDAIYVDINAVLEDNDGNYETTSDQTKLEGYIKLEIDFNFNLGVDILGLNYLYFDNWIIEEINLTLKSSKELAKYNPETTLATLHFGVITIPVPPVVITIHPQLPIKVGALFEAALTLESEIQQNATLQSGFKYNRDDGWETIDSKDYNFEYELPTPKAEARAKGYINPRLELLFYDVAGPWTGVKGYLEVDAKMARTPWWILYSGISVEAGVVVKIFSKELVDKSWELMDFRNELAHAETKFGTISGLVLSPVEKEPLEGVIINFEKDEEIHFTDTSSANGGFYTELEAGNYDIETSKPGYLPASYKNVFLPINALVTLSPIFQIDENYAGTGDISGTITDSLSADVLANVTLIIRKGINNLDGNIKATINSSDNGYFIFSDLEAGNYTLEASKDNYKTKRLTITSLGGQLMEGQDFSMGTVNQEN